MMADVCRYQGYISAALVLGGVDADGPHLYSIYPHGSTDGLPYVTMGQYLSLRSLYILSSDCGSSNPHGSSFSSASSTLGSGSLAAMAVFEDGYKVDMEVSIFLFFVFS